MKRIYFIDSENVGDSWLPLLVREEDDILVFYTSKSPYMSYDGLVMLKESPKDVTFIKCFEGTNALDFQLCSELGYRLNSDKADEFIIITNDTGYDAAVKYWQKKEYPVRRVQSKLVKTLLEPENPAKAETKADKEQKAKDAKRKEQQDAFSKAVKETRPAADAKQQEAAEEAKASNKKEAQPVSSQSEPVPAAKAEESLPEGTVGVQEAVISESAPAQESAERKGRGPRNSRRNRKAAEKAEAAIDERIAEVSDGNPADNKLIRTVELVLEELSAKEEPKEALEKAAEDASDAPETGKTESAKLSETAQESPEADTSEAPKRLSRKEQWRLRQQQRRQKQKERAKEYAEKLAEAENEAAAAPDPVPAIVRVEVKHSGVSVTPPDLSSYRSAEPAATEPAEEAMTVVKEAEIVTEETEPASEEVVVVEAAPDETEAATAEAEAAPEATEAIAEATPAVTEATEAATAETKPAAETEIVAAETVSGAEEIPAVPDVTEAVAAETEAASDETEVIAEEAEAVPEEPETIAEETTGVVAETVAASDETEAVAAEPMAAEETVLTEEEEIPAAAESHAEEMIPADTAAAEEELLFGETNENASAGPGFNKAEVDTIINCIGKANLGDIHNSLELFYGEQGKEIYQVIKSGTYEYEEKKWNKDRRFKKYCDVVFAHAEHPMENAKEFEKFLYASEDKRKNLNSLRHALQAEYGKEAGMQFYSLFKAHIKLLNRM